MCISLLSVISCSTEKNTPITRRVHAIKADYNTYYNGKVAFLEGNAAQLKANKDNHLEVLPLLTIGNKSTLSAGKANYARAIEKSKKAIKQHSISKRPQWNSNKPKTQKDKLWLSQREYNPFLYKAWFMMGESQLRQGEYLEAASTFAYMQRLYFSKPNIVAKARVLEALCYAEQDWHFQAEDLIARAERDSFPTKLNYMKAQVLADCNIRQKNMQKPFRMSSKSSRSRRAVTKRRVSTISSDNSISRRDRKNWHTSPSERSSQRILLTNLHSMPVFSRQRCSQKATPRR